MARRSRNLQRGEGSNKLWLEFVRSEPDVGWNGDVLCFEEILGIIA